MSTTGGAKRPVKEAAMPPGLVAIHKACSAIYSNQPNPQQASALVKYWLGGPDPLDYIFIYYHSGSAQVDGSAQPPDGKKASPPHWHYVSCGLSDLHGDGRVHESSSGPNALSGFGFELTFRLSLETVMVGGTPPAPPSWPAELLQSLARYVFSSGNVLCAGDHVSWHVPLDPQQDSPMQHMLLAPDPELGGIKSPLGDLQFVQVVGATQKELNMAQMWNVLGILDLMRNNTVCGGELLVTNMRRVESVFDLMPEAWGVVEEGVKTQGSVLSVVSTLCQWEDEVGRSGSMVPPDMSLELMPRVVLNRAHLIFNWEALQLWPLAIRGRLSHGNHFTFKNASGDMAITMVTAGVDGAMASETTPLVSHGAWLQIFLTRDIYSNFLKKLNHFLQFSPLEVGGAEAELAGQPLPSSHLPAQLKIPEVGVTITAVATPSQNGFVQPPQ